MNKVFLQLWEESEISGDHQSNGCSLHISELSRENYIKKIYSDRNDIVPDKYDKIIGSSIIVFVEDNLYNHIKEKNDLKIDETSLRNLIKLEELIYNKTDV